MFRLLQACGGSQSRVLNLKETIVNAPQFHFSSYYLGFPLLVLVSWTWTCLPISVHSASPCLIADFLQGHPDFPNWWSHSWIAFLLFNTAFAVRLHGQVLQDLPVGRLVVFLVLDKSSYLFMSPSLISSGGSRNVTNITWITLLIQRLEMCQST